MIQFSVYFRFQFLRVRASKEKISGIRKKNWNWIIKYMIPVIYVKLKQEWAQDRALGYTIFDRFSAWWDSIVCYKLFPTSKVTAEPFQRIVPDTIMI